MIKYLAISVILLFCGCDNLDLEKDAAYQDMRAAIANGAVARGWIPSWVPTNATNLREAHDLDTNESLLLFHVPASSQIALPESCKPAAAESIATPNLERDWWPLDETSRKTYRLYQCSQGDPNEFVAVTSAGVVLHWRAHGR